MNTLHLPSINAIPPYTTTGELAERNYAGQVYDYALPQRWVDAMQERGFDPRGVVVWGYINGKGFGAPWPLTAEAAMSLAQFAQF